MMNRNSEDREMLPCFRWFGPGDPVTPGMIRQCGARGVFTALHQIPAGEIWSRAAIRERREVLADDGFEWTVAESLPVSEAIKTRSGDWELHVERYCQSLRNLGEEGVSCVLYNFMPVLDWVRTDLSVVLPDGSRTVAYDPVRWAAFDLFILQREAAPKDYTAERIEEARQYFGNLDEIGRRRLERDVIDIFPGRKGGIELKDIRVMMDRYRGIGPDVLRDNLASFLKAVVPVAESSGIRLAVHPDDPPFPVLGLPRIVSTEEDLAFITGLLDSDANGICICPGSLAVRPDNDIPGITHRFAGRIHAVHLRNIVRRESGYFREAPHLGGVIDMPAVVSLLLKEQDRRREQGRHDWRMPMRPDHGLTLLDDLEKPPPVTPGYTCLGRMKGLAELRGLQSGLLAKEG